MARIIRSRCDPSPVLVAALFLITVLVALPSRGFAQTKVGIDFDVPFADHGGVHLRMDIAYPMPLEGSRPALVYISGSGWGHWWGRSFDRHQYDTAIRLAAEHGYVAATVGYRPTSTATGTPTADRYPDQLLDVRSAVRWLRAHAAKYHIDAARIGAIGWSSGGHLALMLGLLPAGARFQGENDNPSYSSSVEAVVSIAGATELARMYEETELAGARDALLELMGGRPSDLPRAYRAASPLYLVTASAPPILLVHGDADHEVPLDQSTMLLERLKAAGDEAKLITVDHGFHSNYYMQPSILPFFDSVLKVEKRSLMGRIEDYIRIGWSRLASLPLLRTR